MTAILDNDTAAAELIGKHHAPRVTERAARIMAYNQATLYVLKMSPYREIIRNSVDTHIETGVTDPVRIHLDFNRNIVTVEDNGSGLSLQELHDLVQSPGESSKSGADRKAGVVGRLGIGSLAMVKLADRVYFTSSKDGDETYVLRQEARDGGVDFSYERAAALGRRGTTVTAFLNDDLDESHIDAIRWMLRFLPAGSVLMTTSRDRDEDVVAGELRDEDGELVRTAITSRGTIGVVAPMHEDSYRYNNLSYHDGSVLILNGHDPYDASALVRQAVEDIRRNEDDEVVSVLGEVLDSSDEPVEDKDSFATPLGNMSRKLLASMFYRYLHGAASTSNYNGSRPVLVIESDIDQYTFDAPRENMSITAANLNQMRTILRAEADAFVDDMVRLYSVANVADVQAAYTKKRAAALRSVAESQNMFTVPNRPSEWTGKIGNILTGQEPYKSLFGLSGENRTSKIMDKFSTLRDADEDTALLAVRVPDHFTETVSALESVYRQVRPNIERLTVLRATIALHEKTLADKPEKHEDGRPVNLEYTQALLNDQNDKYRTLASQILRPKKSDTAVVYRTGTNMKITDDGNTVVVVNCPPEVVSATTNPARFDKPGVAAAVEYLRDEHDTAVRVVFTNASEVATATAKASLTKSATLTTMDWEVLDVKAAKHREMIVSYSRSKRERKARTAADSVLLVAAARDGFEWHPVSEEDFADQTFRKNQDGELLDVVVLDLDYDDPKTRRHNRWDTPRRQPRNVADSQFYGLVQSMSPLADLSSFVLVTTVKRGYRLPRLERELAVHGDAYRSDDYLSWFLGEVVAKIDPVLSGLDREELSASLELHASVKKHTGRAPADKKLVAVVKAIQKAVPGVSTMRPDERRDALHRLAYNSESTRAVRLLERVVDLRTTPEDGEVSESQRYHDETVAMAKAALSGLDDDERTCERFGDTLRDWRALTHNRLIESLGKDERRDLLRAMADKLNLDTE